MFLKKYKWFYIIPFSVLLSVLFSFFLKGRVERLMDCLPHYGITKPYRYTPKLKYVLECTMHNGPIIYGEGPLREKDFSPSEYPNIN